VGVSLRHNTVDYFSINAKQNMKSTTSFPFALENLTLSRNVSFVSDYSSTRFLFIFLCLNLAYDHTTFSRNLELSNKLDNFQYEEVET